MGQLTLKVDDTTIKQMKAYYDAHLDKAPQGAIFRARTTHAVITAYRSGKVLFQGNHVEAEAAKWGDQQTANATTPKIKKTSQTPTYRPPDTLLNGNHIGSDESGTGDYFGPVTTAAVYVTAEQIPILKELGIQDSKKINDQLALHLAQQLAEMQIPYSLMILHNDKYNRLQAQGWSQGKMKAMLHQSTITRLIHKLDHTNYEGILIDQFCQPSVYLNYLTSEQEKLPKHTYFMTKAEHYSIAVAAGSVIARASFLKEMERLSEQVGVPLMKGASNKVDRLIANIIRTQGEDTLYNIAKLHFKNTDKAQQYI